MTASSHNSISILTPTYRGRSRLKTVFRSISAQSFMPSEWIIVLDGFDKETHAVASSFSIPGVTIVVDVIAHNHKKAAINRGVSLCTGDFVVIADDDDPFPQDALLEFVSAWEQINDKDRSEFVGVTGLCDDGSGKIVGDSFPSGVFDCTAVECFFHHNVSGEKWGMLRRDILRRYPFFEDAQGYVGESTVWMEIGKIYKTRYINKVVRNYITRDGSIMNSKVSAEQISKNCQAYVYGYAYTVRNFQQLVLRRPKYIIACAANHVRYFLHCMSMDKIKPWMINDFPKSSLPITLIALPVGMFLYLRDRMRFK